MTANRDVGAAQFEAPRDDNIVFGSLPPLLREKMSALDTDSGL